MATCPNCHCLKCQDAKFARFEKLWQMVTDAGLANDLHELITEVRGDETPVNATRKK